ncbi:LppU/SCO3897 family protein [Rugosimonospora acidiphila]|uniref:LppU/SCO3897 family protein n=1 Tax=Rugosimonospora acidiphila TaxID=556531 RepID=UPI0031F1915E
MVALVTVVVLVVCAGGTLALYLMRQGPAAAARSAPTATPSGAAASPGYDPAAIARGQCVANDGTVEAPKLRVVACAPGSYLVLARLDGTSDTNRCTIIPGSTHEFYYQTAPSTSDFVLCLKQQ